MSETSAWQQYETDFLPNDIGAALGAVDERKVRGESFDDTVEEMVQEVAFSGLTSELGTEFLDPTPYLRQFPTVEEQIQNAIVVASHLYRLALAENSKRKRAGLVLVAASFHGIFAALRTEIKTLMDREEDKENVAGYEKLHEMNDDVILHHAIVTTCRIALSHVLGMADKHDPVDVTHDKLLDNADNKRDHPSISRRLAKSQEKAFDEPIKWLKEYASALSQPKMSRPASVQRIGTSEIVEADAIDHESLRTVWSAVEERTTYTRLLQKALEETVTTIEKGMPKNEIAGEVTVLEKKLMIVSLQRMICDILEVVFSAIPIEYVELRDARFSHLSIKDEEILLVIEKSVGEYSQTQITFVLENIASIRKAYNSNQRDVNLSLILYKFGSPFSKQKKGSTFAPKSRAQEEKEKKKKKEQKKSRKQQRRR